MEALNGIDLDSDRKTSGNGFYYLKGDIARLHSAILSYARDFMVGRGFTYCMVRMDDKQQKLYDGQVVRTLNFVESQSRENLAKSKIQVLAEITRLRQICCDPSLLFEDYNERFATRCHIGFNKARADMVSYQSAFL